jgi:predicted nicotinamide N-methyase
VNSDFVLANTRSAPVPLVPEITLRLADEPFSLWERTDSLPYWAFAWAGGQALARYVLDNPSVVAGRRVLDVASGSGLVAIAAARAGAAEIAATDIDPLAVLAIGINAAANDVVVTASCVDVLEADVLEADVLEADVLDDDVSAGVVLAGDVWYDRAMADRMLAFVDRATAAGAVVLVGDPGRAHFPKAGFTALATYSVPVTETLEAGDTMRATVWRR